MTKDQVIEKFKEFASAMQEYTSQKENGKITKLSAVAILSELNEDETSISTTSLLCGNKGIIEDGISAATEKDKTLVDIIMNCAAKNVSDKLKTISNKIAAKS